ncbi:tyrosine-type recombinase/integrase [Rhodanobacter denitrificans]|uniref:tyrosine-type recombinase/integrase n=2 Tax=Rhodanobacter TaxID=75309 RepID=UPI0009DB3B6C|nr:tyrosine-type recombinase/integrase [Rhodanobacter denitrificans]UJM89035.1 tyrosine-type recombinase/integrase [Rhodanobacter denitrificans]
MITVAVSQGPPERPDLVRDSLPEGYSYVVDDELSTPIEPILLWLCSTYPPKRGMWRPSTVEAAAYDLCDWWRFLTHTKTEWDQVSSDDLSNYRDGLLAAVSFRQKKAYDPKTIGRRVKAVGAFYSWAINNGYFLGEPVSPKKLKAICRPIDENALAHAGAMAYREIDTLAPRRNIDSDERVCPLSPTEWRDIAAALGPLPSQNRDGLQGWSRDRLACEVSLWTGMRVDEVSGLVVHQILELSSRVREASTAAVEITRTKGLRKRKVLFPKHLVDELITYIDGERAEAIAVGRRFGLKKAPAALFVNGAASRNHAGRPIQAYTLSGAFRQAVETVGLLRRVERIEPLTSTRFITLMPAHTFHDLRHTFAVFLYQAEIACGNPEPWKIIQARLGHRHLQTTRDTYLRIVDIFRIRTNDEVYRYLRSIHGP